MKGRLLLLGLFSAGAILMPSTSVLGNFATDDDPGEEHPELEPGDLFEDLGGLAAIVPKPGRWAAAEAFMTDGADQSLAIETGTDGSVTVYSGGVEEGEPPPEPPGECTDPAYSPHTWWWSQQLNWRFKADSTPSEMTQDGARTAIRAATSNITNAFNICDISDQVSATAEYKGDTPTGPNISTQNGCLAEDGLSVVSYGDLQADTLGLTCVWGNGQLFPTGGIADESDIKLNKFEYTWYGELGPNCQGKISTKGITTHERGHTFGIAHVSNTNHPNLTMRSGGIESVTCNDKLASLGLGDLNGLEYRY